MRKVLLALLGAAMVLTLSGTAAADIKRFSVTLQAKGSGPGYVLVQSCEGKPLGTELRLTGTVSPIRKDKRIRIYKKLDGGSWTIEGEARVRSSGRFTFIDRPTSLTARHYKARMPTVGSWRFAYSDAVRVTTHKDTCPD